ncbi:MAG: zf-HC2 domain-containing protein [Myxococcota bacterium]
MLTCQEITQLCTAYLERSLSPVDRLRFQFHIAMCKHCRTYFKQMQATVDALGTLPSEPLPPEIESELLHRFRGWKHGA